MPPREGRIQILLDVHEIAVVDMVIANNPVKLGEIRHRVLADDITFGNANMVLEKHKTLMQQLHIVHISK